MNEAFYENIHQATLSYPHVEFDSRNLTYLSHFHDEIEIAYLAEGHSTVFCDNKKTEASEGDLFIFMPGQIHSFLCADMNRFHIFKLYCKNDADKTDFSKLRPVNIPVNRDEDIYPRLLGSFEEFRKESESGAPGQAYMLNSLANRMVCHILRYCRLTETDRKEDKKSKLNTELLTKVNEYIEHNYTEKINLTDMAKICGLSDYYFAHMFKSVTGTTFFDHLTVFRLEKALEKHIGTGINLTDCALACGFTNIRSFYRLFKKHFGISPKEYLRQTEI